MEYGQRRVYSAGGRCLQRRSIIAHQGSIKRMGRQRHSVNAIAPGYVATEMNAALMGDENRAKSILERIPAGRWGAPEDFKGPVLVLASATSQYVSGECLVVDGGWMGR